MSDFDVDVDVPDGEQSKQVPPFKLASLWDLCREPATTWLVQGLIPDTGVAVVAGQPNSGKTFLALHLALHIALGRGWFGRRVDQRGVVYIALEGGGGMSNRARALLAGAGVENDRDIPLHVIHRQAFHLLLDEAQLLQTLAGLDRPVVFIDTLAVATVGGEENSNSDMAQAMAAAGRISSATGSPVILLHHPSKADPKSLRGGSALLGAVDTVVLVENKDGARSWRVTKSRDGSTDLEGHFRLRVENLSPGAKPGHEVTSCSVEPDEARTALATAGVKPEPQLKAPRGANQVKVLEIVQRMGPEGGPVRISSLVEAFRPSLPEADRKRANGRVATALEGLSGLGWITADGSVVRLLKRGIPPAASGGS